MAHTDLAAAITRARKAAAALSPKLKDDQGSAGASTSSSGDLATGDLQTGGGELAPDQSGVQSRPGKTRHHQGITVVIDRPLGHVQRGKGADGTPWERTYKNDYGFIPGTLGGDGEGLDVFFGDAEEAPTAHWAIQQKADGTFDEYKLLFGFENEQKARDAYVAHIPEKFLKGMTSTTVQMCKALLGLEPAEVLKRLLLEEVGERFELDLARKAAAGPAPAPSTPSTDEHPLEMKFARIIVRKADAGEQRLVLGVVLEPDVVDSQGDTYSAEEIERTAHDWMERFRNIDLQHKVFVNGLVNPVESFIATQDLDVAGQPVKAGTWLLRVHVVDDQIWDQVKSGALTGFSINGFAQRTALAGATAAP